MKKIHTDHQEIEIKELNPYEKNSRKHPKDQIKKIAASIKEFGFTNPILIDENNMILAGHGRLAAAKTLRMKKVPCVVAKGLSEEKKKAYIIADNRTAEDGEWDLDMLKSEIESLGEENYDLNLTGFDDNFLTNLLDEPEETKEPETKGSTTNETESGSTTGNGKDEIKKVNHFENVEAKDNPTGPTAEDYQESAIRQIILIYGIVEYEATIEAMAEYAEKFGLQDNTEVVSHLLRQQGYEIPESIDENTESGSDSN